MFLLVRRLVERSARWLVRHAQSLALGPTVDGFRSGVRAVTAALPELLVGSVAHAAETTAVRFVEAGVAPDLARRVATSAAALVGLPAVALAREHDLDATTVARSQFLLDDRLGLD